MRPILARKPLPQVGQKWVGAVLALVALALRAAVPVSTQLEGTCAPLLRGLL